MCKTVFAISSFFLCVSALAQETAPEYKSPRQWSTAAQVAQNQKDYALAITDYKQAMAGGYINSNNLYDLACAYALVNQSGEALVALEKSIAMGFHSAAQVQSDSDLSKLHTDPRWVKIIERVKKNAASYHSSHSDPEGFKIVTSDIDLFWKAYDQLPAQRDPSAFLEHNYLDPGTAGLHGFIVHRIDSGEKLNQAIKDHPKFYAAIRNNTLHLASVEPQVRAAMRKFKAIYEDADFPDVYFIVGRFSSGGTASSDGLIMGAEIFSGGPGIPVDELDDWQRSVIETSDPLPSIVAHELMHFQQNYDSSDMLGGIIKEGSADFLASLVTDGNFNQRIYDYGYAHESELRALFLRDMKKNDSSNWLYHGSKTKDRPADLGYFMGFRITQAFYQRAPDKKQAVIDILNIKDFNKFVQDSGYFEEFK
jgi:tetratricopeptide (TPR) repeat protein